MSQPTDVHQLSAPPWHTHTLGTGQAELHAGPAAWTTVLGPSSSCHLSVSNLCNKDQRRVPDRPLFLEDTSHPLGELATAGSSPRPILSGMCTYSTTAQGQQRASAQPQAWILRRRVSNRGRDLCSVQEQERARHPQQRSRSPVCFCRWRVRVGERPAPPGPLRGAGAVFHGCWPGAGWAWPGRFPVVRSPLSHPVDFLGLTFFCASVDLSTGQTTRTPGSELPAVVTLRSLRGSAAPPAWQRPVFSRRVLGDAWAVRGGRRSWRDGATLFGRARVSVIESCHLNIVTAAGAPPPFPTLASRALSLRLTNSVRVTVFTLTSPLSCGIFGILFLNLQHTRSCAFL